MDAIPQDTFASGKCGRSSYRDDVWLIQLMIHNRESPQVSMYELYVGKRSHSGRLGQNENINMDGINGFGMLRVLKL